MHHNLMVILVSINRRAAASRDVLLPIIQPIKKKHPIFYLPLFLARPEPQDLSRPSEEAHFTLDFSAGRSPRKTLLKKADASQTHSFSRQIINDFLLSQDPKRRQPEPFLHVSGQKRDVSGQLQQARLRQRPGLRTATRDLSYPYQPPRSCPFAVAQRVFGAAAATSPPLLRLEIRSCFCKRRPRQDSNHRRGTRGRTPGSAPPSLLAWTNHFITPRGGDRGG